MVLCAVGQLCSRGSVLENLRGCQSIIRRASARGAKMVFLPEASDFIASPKTYSELSKPLSDSPFVKGCQTSARECDCWVSVGVHEKVHIGHDAPKVFNTSLIISNQGIIQQKYQKLHLFDIDVNRHTSSNESKFISPGNVLPHPITTPIGTVGQLICYDLRFPEPALIHRQNRAEILAYPSAFTIRTGGAHWEILLRARAIETQCYVVAAAQVGIHMDEPRRSSWGHAMIIDPWGTILSQVPDSIPSSSPKRCDPSSIPSTTDQIKDEEWGTSFALADIELDSLHRLRGSMPVLNQRRYDIYPKLT